MQVSAINSFNNVNFAAKNKLSAKSQENVDAGFEPNKRFMGKLSGPVAAAMFMIPVVTTLPSCESNVTAIATANSNTTIVLPDVPTEFEFPSDIQDSLNIWRGDYLDIGFDNDDGVFTNKALLNLSGARNWDYDKPESITLNLEKCGKNQAVYDHVSGNSVKTELVVDKVKPYEIVVVKKDGTETEQLSGLMFNDDGRKVFAHSNGKDKIYVYPKASSGENAGKYVELGTIERGYLPEDGGTPNTQYGKNVLLKDILSEGTEEHFIKINGQAISVDELNAIAEGLE